MLCAPRPRSHAAGPTGCDGAVDGRGALEGEPDGAEARADGDVCRHAAAQAAAARRAAVEPARPAAPSGGEEGDI